ncbi:uncharacterized protein LOC131856926 [Cryptomeria japonica]|uniref:uncharacterized protein LOC131856926 n=1 Tax=Cryptomeria japonica TaxID=3369 RepID=UPI0027D9FA61|nr:uncharacterized protein LOC131856926 [Cryptomeria japonica]
MRPLPDDEKEAQSVNNLLVVGEKEFMKTLKEKNTPCFAIIVKSKREEKEREEEGKEPLRNVEPKEVQDLLNQYKDVIADSKTETLPPIRDVNHCIDFIPRSTLPNKAAYKLTPDQNEELARQVEELLRKGFIRRSISPRAVPVVLAPKKEGKDKTPPQVRNKSNPTLDFSTPRHTRS